MRAGIKVAPLACLVLALDMPLSPSLAQSPSPQALGDPCNHPALAKHIAEPKAPASAYGDIKGAQAVARVQVWTNENGRPTDARVIASTGNAALDQAAVSAAKASTFYPAAAACGTIPSTFAIQMTFEKTDYACNHEAQIITQVVPEYPPRSNRFGFFPRNQAIVRVHLDATGKVLGVAMAFSSGVAVLDSAAMEAAKASTYEPKYAGCKPVPGDYLYRITFVQENF